MLARRFGQHLREQNWTAFAIDFSIVVFGVFIGIQAANWNDDRALRDREESYLRQLVIDLEGDVSTGDRGLESADDIDQAAATLLAVAQGRAGALSDEEIVTSVAEAGYAYIPRANRATYQELLSTGALSLIESPQLKRELARYYGWAESGRQWDDLLREEQTAYRAAIRGILTREQFSWARTNFSDPGAPASELPQFDRAAFEADLRSRPEVVDSLASMGAVQARLRGNSEDLKSRAAQLAERINAELGE